jgi:hypothetical protein
MSDMVTAGADLQEFARKERPISDFQLHLDKQDYERNRNYLRDAQQSVTRWEIELMTLRTREKDGRGICDQIGQLAKNHPEFTRDLEKAKAILVKITAQRSAKEINLANARVRVEFFQKAVTTSHTPAIQRSDEVSRLMKQLAG